VANLQADEHEANAYEIAKMTTRVSERLAWAGFGDI